MMMISLFTAVLLAATVYVGTVPTSASAPAPALDWTSVPTSALSSGQFPASVPTSTSAPDSLDAVVAGIHDRMIAIDTHNDFSFAYIFPRPDKKNRKGQVSFALMRRGRLDGAFFAAYLKQGERTDAGHKEAKEKCDLLLEGLTRYAALHASEGAVAGSAAEVRRMKAAGKVAMLLSMENAWPLGRDIGNVQHYRDMGVRMISLTHNGNNEVADAGEGEEEWGGLSPFGREVVAEMNRLGMIVDVAHSSRAACLQAVSASQYPIINSHTGVYNMKQIKRNLTDEEMRAIAEKGGLIQVSIGRFFLSWLPRERVGLEYLVAQINYVVNLVGIAHVGIGSDFDGGGGMVGCEDMGEVKHITRALLEEGYSEAEIALLMGGNVLRLMEVCRCGNF